MSISYSSSLGDSPLKKKSSSGKNSEKKKNSEVDAGNKNIKSPVKKTSDEQ